MCSFVRTFVACWSMLCGSLLWAQEIAAPETASNPAKASTPSTAQPVQNAQVQTGTDQSVIVVAANSDEAIAKVLLRGLDAEPLASDLEGGLLTSVHQPNLLLRPSVALRNATPVNKTGDFLVELEINGLVAFGESNVPLLYKGRQVGSLRFSKPGLVAKPAEEGGFVARESSDLPLVLENPSTFEYKSVRARLRFDNHDVCVFNAENFHGSSVPDENVGQDCDMYESWTPFDFPRYAQVTLRAQPDRRWFLDPDTGFAHSGKRKGWLTLRFQTTAGGPIHEQNLPLEVQMEPGSRSLFRSLLWIAFFLLLGAILSLVLRVSVPNIRRRQQLKGSIRQFLRTSGSLSMLKILQP